MSLGTQNWLDFLAILMLALFALYIAGCLIVTGWSLVGAAREMRRIRQLREGGR